MDKIAREMPVTACILSRRTLQAWAKRIQKDSFSANARLVATAEAMLRAARLHEGERRMQVERRAYTEGVNERH